MPTNLFTNYSFKAASNPKTPLYIFLTVLKTVSIYYFITKIAYHL